MKFFKYTSGRVMAPITLKFMVTRNTVVYTLAGMLELNANDLAEHKTKIVRMNVDKAIRDAVAGRGYAYLEFPNEDVSPEFISKAEAMMDKLYPEFKSLA